MQVCGYPPVGMVLGAVTADRCGIWVVCRELGVRPRVWPMVSMILCMKHLRLSHVMKVQPKVTNFHDTVIVRLAWDSS